MQSKNLLTNSVVRSMRQSTIGNFGTDQVSMERGLCEKKPKGKYFPLQTKFNEKFMI